MSPLTDEEKQMLLHIARQAFEAAVRARPAEEPSPIPQSLNRPSGAFVTLHKKGRLRGCIGHIEGWGSLVRTVQECAVSAALHDPRFSPVTPEEIPEILIEISVLSPLEELTPDQIEVGKHGLLVSIGSRRGLLLPQVAVEWKWDRQKFLEETCLKAGLAADAWKRDAKILGFTAQVFAEPLFSGASSSPSAPGITGARRR